MGLETVELVAPYMVRFSRILHHITVPHKGSDLKGGQSMGKLIKVLTSVICMTLILEFSMAHAFCSATHIYIAQKVFHVSAIDLNYGSVAPDLGIYADEDKWPTAFDDTHYNYIDLRSDARGLRQNLFTKGWITHNEAWGADYYAHRENPLHNNVCATDGYYQGYVIEKACLLSKQTGITPDFAHLVIEVALDLLLCDQVYARQNLGEELLNASLNRSSLDRTLLAKVLVREEPQRTDWRTLASTELAFRGVVDMYARPLALPSPDNEEALAKLAVKLAKFMGIEDITEDEILALLNTAIDLCKDDYKSIMRYVIVAIKSKLGIRR
jgi:hypothetical protein